MNCEKMAGGRGKERVSSITYLLQRFAFVHFVFFSAVGLEFHTGLTLLKSQDRTGPCAVKRETALIAELFATL